MLLVISNFRKSVNRDTCLTDATPHKDQCPLLLSQYLCLNECHAGFSINTGHCIQSVSDGK